MSRKKVTVIIPTFNVEDTLEGCIKSASWADEIFVVDSFSTDSTVEIAKELGARVVQHEYVYSAKQKNWAIPQAENEWILLLDSDEEVTPELRDEILALLDSGDAEKYDGFGIARRHYFLGHWLRWGGRYPLYNIRLFKRHCKYEDRDVHAHIILAKEKTKNLKHDILHFSDPSLDHFLEKFNRYSTYQANYILKMAGKRNQIEWKKLFTHYIYAKSVIKDFWFFLPFVAFFRFAYMYILRLGFLDGRHGFLIAVLYGFQDYVSKTKYLELIGKRPKFRFLVQNGIKKFIPREKGCRDIEDRINSVDRAIA